MTLVEKWNDSFRTLATTVSVRSSATATRLTKHQQKQIWDAGFHDLVSYCGFLVWSEFRNLRDVRSLFGANVIYNFLVRRGNTGDEVNQFLEAQYMRWRSENRGKSKNTDEQDDLFPQKTTRNTQHWMIGPTVEWLWNHGYGNSRDMESWYWRNEIILANDIHMRDNESSALEWPYSKSMKNAVANWRNTLNLETVILSSDLRFIAKRLAKDLIYGSCNCYAGLSLTERAKNAAINRCRSHNLTTENLFKAANGGLTSFQQKLYTTPIEFLERSIVIHTNQSLSDSKLAGMFYQYFATPRGNGLTIERVRDDQRKSRVTERERSSNLFYIAADPTITTHSSDDSQFLIARIVGGEQCVSIDSDILENAPLEFAFADDCDICPGSEFYLSLSICQQSHGWVGNKKCPICKAKPKRNKCEVMFAVPSDEILKKGRRWVATLLSQETLERKRNEPQLHR